MKDSCTVHCIDVFSETAMGKKVYAQSNSESEYVTSVYKYVIFFLFLILKTYLQRA